MPLGDIVIKGISNLSPAELQKIRLRLNAMEAHDAITRGWIGEDGQLNVLNLHADSGDFDIMPGGGAYFYFVTDQTIPNDTETALVWDGTLLGVNSKYLVLDSSDRSKILLKTNFYKRFFMVFGWLKWCQNSTGRRAVKVEQHDASGTLVHTSYIYSMLGADASDATVTPFIAPQAFQPTTAYIRIMAIQESGGALIINGSDMGIFIYR